MYNIMLVNQDERVREGWGKLSRNHSYRIMNVMFFLFVRLDGVAAAVKKCCLVGCIEVKIPRNRLESPEVVGDRCTSIAVHSLDLGATRGGWSAPHPGRFTPGKDPVPIVQEAEWAPRPVWTCAKNFAPTGIFFIEHLEQVYSTNKAVVTKRRTS
jgi:hypothetical protein